MGDGCNEGDDVCQDLGGKLWRHCWQDLGVRVVVEVRGGGRILLLSGLVLEVSSDMLALQEKRERRGWIFIY